MSTGSASSNLAARTKRVANSSLKIFQLPRSSVVFYDNGKVVEHLNQKDREIKFFLSSYSPISPPSEPERSDPTPSVRSFSQDYFPRNESSSTLSVPHLAPPSISSSLTQSPSRSSADLESPTPSEELTSSTQDPDIVKWVRRVSLESFEPMSHLEPQESGEEDEEAVDEQEIEEVPERRWGFAFDEFNAGVEGGF